MITLSCGDFGGARHDLAVQRVWYTQHVVEFYLNGRVNVPPIQLGDLTHFEIAITRHNSNEFMPFDQSIPMNVVCSIDIVHIWDFGWIPPVRME